MDYYVSTILLEIFHKTNYQLWALIRLNEPSKQNDMMLLFCIFILISEVSSGYLVLLLKNKIKP